MFLIIILIIIITRLDIDVLARLCTVLNCGIGDLLEFIPPEKIEK
ncbi:helix-turn-helix domain-containing protein [uncultured Subdoligranulum sp.]